MAQDHSFDVVSDYDHQELVNAIDQTKKEVLNRYDFKDITKEIEFEKDSITVTSSGDMQLRAIKDILQGKMHKRGIDIRVLDPQKPEDAAKGNMRQVFKLRRGIKEESAKKLSKQIRDKHPKAQVRIEGDKLRVSAKDIDMLQEIIGTLKGMEFEVPLQYENYR